MTATTLTTPQGSGFWCSENGGGSVQLQRWRFVATSTVVRCGGGEGGRRRTVVNSGKRRNFDGSQCC